MCRRPLHSAQAWKKTPILRATLSQKLAGDVATSLVPFILVLTPKGTIHWLSHSARWQERCQELNLPWALIDAAQRRWINEKMNMGQEQVLHRVVERCGGY